MDSKHKSARVQGGGGQKVTSFGVRLVAGSAPPSAQLAAPARAMVEFSWDPPNPAKTNALWLVLVNPAGQWGITDNSGKNKVVIGDDVKLLYTTKQGEKLGDNKFQCALPKAGTYRLYFGLVASAENWCSDSDAGNVTITVQQAAAPPKKDPPKKIGGAEADGPKKRDPTSPPSGVVTPGSSPKASPSQGAAPQILTFTATPDQVVEGSPVTLSWTLAGGAATEIKVNGETVQGNSCVRKPAQDPTVYTLAVTSGGSTVKQTTHVGTHKPGDVVSGIATLSTGQLLQNPRWVLPSGGGQAGAAAHADTAQLRVDVVSGSAVSLEGRFVRFIIEQQHGGAWGPYDELTGIVHKGTASVNAQLRHPIVDSQPSAASVQAATPTQLRFQAELVQS